MPSKVMDITPPGSEISRFFDNQTVFITGGTGFLGKVLLHKILDTCEDVRKVYLLIRQKKNQGARERLEKLLQECEIFQRLQKNKPQVLQKVEAISGDITCPNLGMESKDKERLVNEVTILFHSAATVKFDDSLKSSLAMNVEGTRSILNLSKEILHLKAFVHVSTAFSHCHLKSIEEEFYEVCDQDKLSEDTNPWPNGYTKSKALAEQMLLENGKEVPLAIVRPSIVVASWQDPMPGWIDNYNGPTGLIVGACTGFLRTMYVNPACVADLIPVDVVINLMCAVAYKVGTGKATKEIPIFHCTSGDLNPLTWGDLKKKGYSSIWRFPYEPKRMFWYPRGTFKANKALDKTLRVLTNWIPALIIDLAMICQKKKPYLVKLTKKMVQGMAVLEYFATRDWNWSSRNTSELYHTLNETDKAKFNFDIIQLKWKSYLDNYALGTRRHLMKQKDETLDDSRKYSSLLYKVDFGLKAVLCGLLLAFLTYCLQSTILTV